MANTNATNGNIAITITHGGEESTVEIAANTPLEDAIKIATKGDTGVSVFIGGKAADTLDKKTTIGEAADGKDKVDVDVTPKTTKNG